MNKEQWNIEFNPECYKKVDRISWDEYFIFQAYLASLRSMDANTQCGCVIVKNKRIISTGYNSFIHSIDDNILPNYRPGTEEEHKAKYDFMIHSEHNAVLNCARHGVSCRNATAYVTGLPCNNCFQYMYQAGINMIVYPKDRNLANMTCNEKEANNRTILRKLTSKYIYIKELELDKKTLQKIDLIKSLRS